MNCEKCQDTGWLPFTKNNKVKCQYCCKHDKGWWELSEGYYGYKKGQDNMCCLNGCGTMLRDLKEKLN